MNTDLVRELEGRLGDLAVLLDENDGPVQTDALRQLALHLRVRGPRHVLALGGANQHTGARWAEILTPAQPINHAGHPDEDQG
jgi:hypothetical protein